MPISDLNWQLNLIRRIGDVDRETGDPVSPTTPGAHGVVLDEIDNLWTMYLDKLQAHPAWGRELFELYIKRAGIELVLAALESRVTFSGIRGAYAVRLSDRITARQAQLDRISDQITLVEKKIGANGGPQIGLITRATPIVPPVPGETANPYGHGPYADSPVVQGSPYWPTRGRR